MRTVCAARAQPRSVVASGTTSQVLVVPTSERLSNAPQVHSWLYGGYFHRNLTTQPTNSVEPLTHFTGEKLMGAVGTRSAGT